jgi:acetate kinase
VALSCYQAKKWIGSFDAALGGLDTLVFAGGIGENSPSIRARICEGLGFLGIELDEARNTENAVVISVESAPAHADNHRFALHGLNALLLSAQRDSRLAGREFSS